MVAGREGNGGQPWGSRLSRGWGQANLLVLLLVLLRLRWLMLCEMIELLMMLLLLLVLVLDTSLVVCTLDDVLNGRGRGPQAKRRRRGRDGWRYRSHPPRGRGLGNGFYDGARSGIAVDSHGREGDRNFLRLTLMLTLMGDDWRQWRRQGNGRGQRRGGGH